MPTYNVQCEVCKKQEIRKLTFNQYDLVKENKFQLNCSCGGIMQLLFDPTGIGFVLKDGSSGGWQTKSSKENTYRTARRQVMSQRERDHVSPKRLVPNFQGDLTSSWKEAKDAAYQSTFDNLKGEHGVKTAVKAATESAKTYNQHIKQEAT